MTKLLCQVFIVFVLFVFCGEFAFAQTAPNVTPRDNVYRIIDIIAAHGLANDIIVGQRPYSRLEVARILKNARTKLTADKPDPSIDKWSDYSSKVGSYNYLDRLLKYYENEYADEMGGLDNTFRLNPLSKFKAQLIANTSKARTIPVNNGQGSIDGVVTSFDRYEYGFTYTDGFNWMMLSEHEFGLTKYVSIFAEPMFVFAVSPTDVDTANIYINKLYTTAGWRNIQLEIGRDNLMWGQGEFGGTLLSSNARPLDMIKLTNPYPWRAPWIFKYLGHMKFDLFVSNLGPQNHFPYTFFYGAKFSIKPCRYVEFGLSHTIMMGGDGAPKVGTFDPITELLPFHKWGGSNIGAANVANNAFGFFDLRIIIPELRGVSLYYDAYIEDSIVRVFRLPDNILNQMSFVVGLYLPRLNKNGDFGARFEYHHIAPLSYQHSEWTSGYTLDRRPMGDPLGPDADGVYATLYWNPKPRLIGRIDLAYEDYDSSTYYTETNADGGGDRVLKLNAGPHEKRIRGSVGIDWKINYTAEVDMSTGYEWIHNWNFVNGSDKNNVFLKLGLSLYFDKFKVNID